MNNPKRGPFDLSIDLDKIPSYKSRFTSLDSLTNPISMEAPEQVDMSAAFDSAKDIREKIGSGQDVRSNPSVILRRKGIRV